MVLDDVVRDAGLLVELAAALDADLLGDGDLHVVDVLAVPERLEEAVGEAEDEEVLDRLLAEVVIDAEDLRLVERLRRRCRSARCALARSWPNGFSMMTRVHGAAGSRRASAARRARPPCRFVTMTPNSAGGTAR